MTEQQLTNAMMIALENKIEDKIDTIRSILQEDDRSIVEQIVMKKNQSSDPLYPKYDRKTCYYQQFWKVYLQNQIMIQKVKDYSIGNRVLHEEVKVLEDSQKEWFEIYTNKSKKKMRRTSDLIQKVYECPFQKCMRMYGSDVSLNLHMKLKHNSGTKTEREVLAKEICLAEQKGQKIKATLNFPPGYLEEFRQNFIKQNE